MFSKIKTCATAKEIWENLTQICEGNDEMKENKLTVAQQKYESIKMKDGETMTEFDERFSAVVIELTSLGKEYSNRELALKVMRALPREWDVKTMAMRESKDLNKLELHDLFANLKAYEFELETRSEAGPSTSQPTKAFSATSVEQCSPSTSKSAEQLSNDAMSLFVKKFGKFMRRSYNPSTPYNNVHKSNKISADMNCFNCGRPGHFAAYCNRPKKEDRYKRDEKNDDRTKERSKDRRMRTRSDRRPNRKNDRKVLVAEESNKNWEDTDTDSSSSSSSSSDSEQEEVHCLMANQTSEDEVFDFSNTEFTREDLITALNEMVHEYRKLSQTFEEFKAENVDLKNSSVEPRSIKLGETDSLQIELSKLKTENEFLSIRSSELESEIEKLKLIMSSWTQSSVSLDKLCEIQKPANNRTGLGFNADESRTGETSTQSHLVYDKFKRMRFVKASVIHDPCESVRYDDQNSSKLNQKGKTGIGFIRPENSKPSWLKNRLDKDKAKAGSKSLVSHQPRRSSKKAKSVWKKVQPRRDPNGQNIKPTLNRSHNISAQTLMDYHTGKAVKVIQVWVAKGVILSGPK
ncbi:hypothetical protein F511_32638 [Dorcoceras hygrometricum]|uniref:CCHC-type domain-containing protein n=1 Tax=Dorcoceras hygrometricum TaxID=472368 RepID=A0A2Z7CDZ8_9LAMI|nr:hypothetical protein F511_32638 [Dorcoceras hygrometricum]